uniref:Uncharacterized protein n=1 Tax=viral metagenome TaxID=1070528 RepID=A0A6C0KWF8_9ZZZZ
MNTIRSIHYHCEECDHAFRSISLEVYTCPSCGGSADHYLLDNRQIAQLFEVRSVENMTDDEILTQLKSYSWFSYNKEIIQACWVILEVLKEDEYYTALHQWMGEHYDLAPTFAEEVGREIETMEHQHELPPHCWSC